jgi:hypothetical protein
MKTMEGKKTFKSYLNLMVEIDVTKPPKAGFTLRKEEGKPLWICLKYERLDIYCLSCGRIGYKLSNCSAPSEVQFPSRYSISLKVNIFSNLPLNPSSAKGFSAGATQFSQTSNTLTHGNDLTQPRGAKPNPKISTSTYTAPTLLYPLKNISIHPSYPHSPSHISEKSSSSTPSSLNATQLLSPTTKNSDGSFMPYPLNAPFSSNQPSPQLQSKNPKVTNIISPTNSKSQTNELHSRPIFTTIQKATEQKSTSPPT